MGWFQNAIDRIKSLSSSLFSNKKDAVQYYQAEYPGLGKGGWKQEIIKDLLEMRGVPADLDKKERQRLKHNLTKRFDPKRLDSPESKNDREYQELGTHLGLFAPPRNGYHVVYDGGAMFSECEPVHFTVDITGEQAQLVADDPGEFLDVIFKIWLQETSEETSSVSSCDYMDVEPTITITANSDSYVPHNPSGHKSHMPHFFKIT